MRVKTVVGSLIIITGLVLGLVSGLLALAGPGAAQAPANGALRQGEITLVVREPDQSAIAGATVEAIDSSGNQHATGTTDANGNVSLVLSQTGYYRVVATKAGYIDSRDIDATGSLREIPTDCEPTYDDDDCIQYQRLADGSFRWPLQASFPSAEVRTDGWIELTKTGTTTVTDSSTDTSNSTPESVVGPAEQDGPIISVPAPDVIIVPPAEIIPAATSEVEGMERTEDKGEIDALEYGDPICDEWITLLEIDEITLDEFLEAGYGPCLGGE
jgi:hypothetical protein